MMSIEVDVAFARSWIYKLLSMAFGYPGDEFQVSLVDDSFLSQIRESAEKLPGYRLADPIKSVGASIEKYGNRIFLDITSEYLNAFESKQDGKCSPYELSYLRGPLFMNTGELADIAGFYKAFGLEVSDGDKDRVDHISIELEFMHFLTLKEAFALRNNNSGGLEICRDAQRKFLEDHLGRWTYAFREQVKRNGNSNFYYQLGRLLDKFVSSDCKLLGVKTIRLKRGQSLHEPNYAEEARCGASGLAKGNVHIK